MTDRSADLSRESNTVIPSPPSNYPVNDLEECTDLLIELDNENIKNVDLSLCYEYFNNHIENFDKVITNIQNVFGTYFERKTEIPILTPEEIDSFKNAVVSVNNNPNDWEVFSGACPCCGSGSSHWVPCGGSCYDGPDAGVDLICACGGGECDYSPGNCGHWELDISCCPECFGKLAVVALIFLA